MIRTFLIVDTRAEAYRLLLQSRFPEVEFLTAASAHQAGEIIARADAVAGFGYSLPEALLARAVQMQWLQLLSSGVEKVVQLPQLTGRLLTSAAGIHGAMVSEMVFALMLSLARNIPNAVRNQMQNKWEPQTGTVIAGKTIAILGMGTIGVALAQRARCFGMQVVGFGSSPRQMDCVDRYAIYGDLLEVVPAVDYVVLAAPLRPGAPYLIDETHIAAMKPSACIINVGRGATLDEEAVVHALNEGRLAGAAFDTLATEPLPPDSPLWSNGRLLITPHVGGRVEEYVALAVEIVATNLQAIQSGRRSDMINLINC